jgi:hypothetical protein
MDGVSANPRSKLEKFDFDQITGGENRVDGASVAPKRNNP